MAKPLKSNKHSINDIMGPGKQGLGQPAMLVGKPVLDFPKDEFDLEKWKQFGLETCTEIFTETGEHPPTLYFIHQHPRKEDRWLMTMFQLAPMFGSKGMKNICRQVMTDWGKQHEAMASLFVSEAHGAFGKKGEKMPDIPEGGVKDMEGAKECLIVMIETMENTTLYAYDILRDRSPDTLPKLDEPETTIMSPEETEGSALGGWLERPEKH